MPSILSDEEAAMDPYALLGVKPESSEKDIQKAYRKQTLLYHPDRVGLGVQCRRSIAHTAAFAES